MLLRANVQLYNTYKTKANGMHLGCIQDASLKLSGVGLTVLGACGQAMDCLLWP